MIISTLFAQVAPEEQLVGIGKGLGVLVVAKGLFDMYSNYRESQDKKASMREFTAQTLHLKDIKDTLTKQSESQAKDTQAIAIGLNNQTDMKKILDRVDTNVHALKIKAGLADDTVHIKKENL